MKHHRLKNKVITNKIVSYKSDINSTNQQMSFKFINLTTLFLTRFYSMSHCLHRIVVEVVLNIIILSCQNNLDEALLLISQVVLLMLNRLLSMR